MDEILEKLGLKYDDLNSMERETLHSWMEAINKNVLTVDTIKKYLAQMRDGVEQELIKTENGTKQDIFLKARLRNYMLLEAFLASPERAKEAMAKALAGIAVGKKVK